MSNNVKRIAEQRPPTGAELRKQYEDMKCAMDDACERIRHVEDVQGWQTKRLEDVEKNLAKRITQAAVAVGASVPIVGEIVPLVRELVPLVVDLVRGLGL